MAGHQQGVLGPRDAHVQQSALLVDAPLVELAAMLGDLVRQLLSIGDVRGVQHRDAQCARRRAVAAQQRRQLGGIGEPAAPRRRRRKHSARQVCHRHHLPLQALCGVHREHLDPVPGDRQRAGGKPFSTTSAASK